MRFFKRFHRRTVSESGYVKECVSPTEPAIRPTRRPASWPLVFSGRAPAAQEAAPQPVERPFAPMDAKTFDMETEITGLKLRNLELLEELTDLQSQYHRTRSDLYHELKNAVQQHDTDRKEIQELRCALDSKLLNISPGPLDVDQALQLALAAGEGDTHLSSPTLGPRSSNDYRSALKLTLKTRAELKTTKKTKKFWKRVAQQDEGNHHLVTPSCSNISSVDERLTLDRQKAVEALLNKRRSGSPMSPVLEVHTPPRPDEAPDSTTTSTIDERNVSCTTPEGVRQNVREPELSPLASDAFKKEVRRLSNPPIGRKRASSKPIPGKSTQQTTKPMPKRLRATTYPSLTPMQPGQALIIKSGNPPPLKGVLQNQQASPSVPSKQPTRSTQHSTRCSTISTHSLKSNVPSRVRSGITGTEPTAPGEHSTAPPHHPRKCPSASRSRMAGHAKPATPAPRPRADTEGSKSRLPVSSLKKQLRRLSLTMTSRSDDKENQARLQTTAPPSPIAKTKLPIRAPPLPQVEG